MKTAGLIVEYNPFHKGHLYHIEKTKEVTGADTIIAVMSGNFVQRGAPAVMPKHLRARCALLCGASAVIELPVCYAAASAEYLALGAVSLLDRLGCVDAVCFGSECGDIKILEEIADIVEEEPEEYRALLKEALKTGLSFPLARQHALMQYEAILSEPNNILGIEYLKALKRLNSPMKAFTIRRAGAGYHDTVISGGFSSASAIRTCIDSFPEIRNQIPENCHAVIQEAYHRRFPIQNGDFSLLLKTALLSETPDSLVRYLDINRGLANRIINMRNDFLNLEQFCGLLKTKELTYSRISRALFHILLNITKQNMEDYRNAGSVFYARVLGFREQDSALLRLLKQSSQIPVITRLSQKKLPDSAGSSMMDTDIYAADLYESVVTGKFQTPFINELQQSVIKLPPAQS